MIGVAISVVFSAPGVGEAPADQTAPATPTGFSVTAGDTLNTLTWTDPADADLASIRIYRSTTSGSGHTLLDTVAAGVETYSDEGLSNGTTYYYYLTAIDEVPNESNPTAEESGTPAAPAASISNLTVTPGNGTAVLAWTESGTIDSVNIYRDDVLFDSVAGGVGTYTSAVMADGIYNWYLRPVVSAVEGSASNTVTRGNMAADVWVDSVNGSDSNDGSTPALAVATLNKAGSLVNAAGMRIAVRGGTYSEYNARITSADLGNPPLTTFTQNGTSGAPCELRSFPGENVIIDGSSITRPLPGVSDPQTPELFTVSGDYWHVAGWPGYPIHIQNSAGCGYRTRLSVGHTVEHVYSHDHEGSAFNMQESNDWVVRDCAGWSVYSTSNDGETADGVSAAGCDNGLVEDCFFAWCGDDGVDFITATNCTVQNTVVYRSNYFANGTTGNGNGNGFKLAHATNQSSGNRALNCIAFECDSIGFDFNDGGALAAQCTSIGNRYGFAIGSSTNDNVVSMRENIAYNNSTTNILYNGVIPLLDVYNSWSTPPGVTVTGADFQTLTFNEAWRTWDEVVAASFAGLASNSDMKGAGENGQDLGYEGEYTAEIAIPNIGDNVYGGYMAGIIDTTVGNIIAADAYQTGRRYLLIVSPKSLEVVVDSSRQWSSVNADLAGAKTRWDGLAATEAMVAAGATFEAAAYVDGLSFDADGGSQWYIPAMDELELLYRNLKPTSTANATSSETNTFPGTAQTFGVNPSSDPQGAAYSAGAPTQTGVTAFQSGGTEALPGAPLQTVMTSSWATATTMWVQDMGDGWQFGMSQTQSSNLSIRPVRRIYLDE